MAEIQPTVVVHGGAGLYKDIVDDPCKRAIRERAIIQAVRQGYAKFADGGSAVDAVEAAVVCMEDDPLFNCGYGSYMTTDGTIEMDASIMEGSKLATGAVGVITNVRNPIKVARAVMEKTEHTMFAGQAALNFANCVGFETVPSNALETEKSIDLLKRKPEFEPWVNPSIYKKRTPEKSSSDTVGAIAIDKDGNVAFANSTGGITGKMPGRVGDSPIIGAGGYADNNTGAVATTGHGESFIKTCLAHTIITLMEGGMSPQEAMDTSLDYMEQRVGGLGGCIAMDKEGRFAVALNTHGMAWAAASAKEIQYGVTKGEQKFETL